MNTVPISNVKFRRMFTHILGILVILAMAFPATGSVSAQEPAYTVGLVLNSAGLDDNSFNQMAYNALEQARIDLGVNTLLYEPGDSSEYDAVLQQCADQNELCIAVGFDYQVSLANASRKNLDTQWGIVDVFYPDCWEGAIEGVDCGSFTDLPNVRGMRFNEKQSGYLAGVLAARMTSSNIIGAVGGMEIPPVVAFVEGYRNGAQCTNPDANVLYTYTGTFVDPDVGRIAAQGMIDQGADVIFGAAGMTGDGAILYGAQEQKWVIGVDDDRYLSLFDGGTVTGADRLLSSAMKRVDNAVYQTIADYVNGAFSTGTFSYDLANDGVGLAPFHDTETVVPPEVKGQLDAVRQGIIDGTINIDDACVPQPPRIYAGLTDDSIRYEYTDPYASVTYSIYDAPDGNLLWQDTRTADEAGGSWVSIWDHRQELVPGTFITVFDGVHENQLVVQEVSIDTVDAEENILTGKAPEGSSVWVVANNEPDRCGISIDVGPGNTWQFDFDDLSCDITADMVFYAQVMDAEADTSEANPDFIDGWHDGNEGIGHPNSCTASGFVVDTDDRNRDVAIRILSDGEEVASATADLAWNELVGVCGSDGSCGFNVNLWGLISTYEPHQIAVQALDAESNEWKDLGGTPRSLTCVNYDIYAFNPLSGIVERITALEDSGEYDPSWSPNGKYIVHDVAGAGFNTLYITDVRTHVSKELLGGTNGNDSAWSPNGKWIAFDRRWIAEPNLYIVPATGGRPALLKEDAVRLDWAPNSKRVVFQRPSDGSIGTAAADGGRGGETTVALSGADPAWSPDGHWIAYESNGNLWKVPVNILGRALGDPIQLTYLSGWSIGAPTWSLDNQTITFNGGVGADHDLWQVPAAGGEPTWLAGAAGYGEYGPENSRNTSLIAYAGASPDVQAPRRWMSFWSYKPPVGTLVEGQRNYQYHIVYTVPETVEWVSVPRTVNITNDAPLYEGNALLGPWAYAPQQAWTGSSCEVVDAMNPGQPVRFAWGWVNDYDMTYEEAISHFTSFSIDVSWDGDAAGTAPLEMGGLVPYEGSTTRMAYLCTLTEHP